MTDIQAILAFLKRTYPVPEVDPSWVRECVQALNDEGQQATVDEVHIQYLHADLSVSTLESRAFPSGELHDRLVFPRPTLLQIHAISEVGNSAFQIQTAMEQRSEVLSGQSRIRRLDDEEDEGEEEEDGKVPPYPRSMLKLELGDGRRIIKAMEYKKISELVLGQTSLGCKLLVQNVKCLRDTLLLAPDNTQVLESSVEHLEALQKAQFLDDLKRRMGKLDGPAAVQRPARVPPPVRPVQLPELAPARGRPRGALPADPQAEAGPSTSTRTRDQRAVPLFDPPSSPPVIRPTPSRHPAIKASRRRSTESPSPERPPSRLRKPRKSTRAAGREATAHVQQLYHDIPDEPLDSNDDVDADEFDYDVDESFIRQIDEVEARASGSAAPRRTLPGPVSGQGRHTHNYDSDEDQDDFMILDESMIRQIDAIGASEHGRRHRVNQLAEDGVYSSSASASASDKKGKRRVHDPDEYDDDGFMVDESLIRHLDEVEAVGQASYASSASRLGSQSTLTLRGTTSTSSGRGRAAGTGPSRKNNGGAHSQRLNRSSGIEVIEISD